MSIKTYNIKVINNNNLKTEAEILTEYYNYLVKECRKDTKGKSYDELDAMEDPFRRFQNRLGYFEDELNYTISKMKNEITYIKHKEELTKLQDTNCLYEWDYTDNPLDDLNTYAKILRKKLKHVIKIYNQHKFRKTTLISGYDYYKNQW